MHCFQIQKPIQPSMSGATVVTIPRPNTAQAGMRQAIHVPGNKFQYIRLANPGTGGIGSELNFYRNFLNA